MQSQTMFLESDAIDETGYIDPRYTCDIDNSSPELRWNNVPEATTGFALVAEDPDSLPGPFTHWIIYDIPSRIHHLPAGIPPQEALPNGIRQGINSFGKLGYSGPCPPLGVSFHRYVFRLFALREVPRLPSRARREDLLQTISPFIIAEASIVAKYQRAIQRAG